MKTKTNFILLPVGTKVWSSQKGWGEITDNCGSGMYPVTVKYKGNCKCGGDRHIYTAGGYYSTHDVYPSLFLEPLPGFEDGSALLADETDKRIGKKCIFWNNDCTLDIGLLVSVDYDLCFPYKMKNGNITGVFKNCVIYTPEVIIQITKDI